jgi:transposase
MLTKIDMDIPLELLGLSDIKLTEINLRNKRELIIKVESTKETTTCRNCGKDCKSHGYDRPMELRHLSMFGYKTIIQLTPKRGICHDCSDKPITTTQTLDWYDRNARQTKPYEDHLLFELINSTVADVSRKEEIDYHTIDSLIDKKIETKVDFSLILFLGVIGIDEISLRKGRQKYVTVITYRHNDEVKILAVLKGRTKKAVKGFFESIPYRLKQTVTAVCSDLYDGFINAAKEVFGDKVITADRFHVAKLYRKQLITVRKSELAKLKKKLTAEEYKSLKDGIALLRKGRDYFTEEEKLIVFDLFNYSPKLRLAYQFSRQLTAIFATHHSKEEAEAEFRNWISEVSSSELTCFKTFIKTLKKYMNEITNYFLERNSSGFVEGFNNKIKVLTRRSYGLRSAERLFQRLKLDTEGLGMFKFAGAY